MPGVLPSINSALLTCSYRMELSFAHSGLLVLGQ
jgi:hypothetical protein